MATLVNKNSIGVTVGIIAAGAGFAAYYLFMLDRKEEKSEVEPDATPVTSEPKNDIVADHDIFLNENITDLQKETDSCKILPTGIEDEKDAKKIEAAAITSQKLKTNVNFQQFSQSKGLNVSKEVEEIKVSEKALKHDAIKNDENKETLEIKEVEEINLIKMVHKQDAIKNDDNKDIIENKVVGEIEVEEKMLKPNTLKTYDYKDALEVIGSTEKDNVVQSEEEEGLKSKSSSAEITKIPFEKSSRLEKEVSSLKSDSFEKEVYQNPVETEQKNPPPPTGEKSQNPLEKSISSDKVQKSPTQDESLDQGKDPNSSLTRSTSSEKEITLNPQLDLKPDSSHTLPSTPSVKNLKSMDSSFEIIEGMKSPLNSESIVLNKSLSQDISEAKSTATSTRSPSPFTLSKSLTVTAAKATSSDYDESSEDIKSDSESEEIVDDDNTGDNFGGADKNDEKKLSKSSSEASDSDSSDSEPSESDSKTSSENDTESLKSNKSIK